MRRGLAMAAVLGVALALPAGEAARAAPVSFDFHVTFDEGPLSGRSFTGTATLEGDDLVGSGSEDFRPAGATEGTGELLDIFITIDEHHFPMSEDINFPTFPAVFLEDGQVDGFNFIVHGPASFELIGFDAEFTDGEVSSFGTAMAEAIARAVEDRAQAQEDAQTTTAVQTSRSALRSLGRTISARVNLLRRLDRRGAGGQGARGVQLARSTDIAGDTQLALRDDGMLDGRLGLWGGVDHVHTRWRGDNAFRSDLTIVTAGADYLVGDRAVVGVVTGYEHSDQDFRARSGEGWARGGFGGVYGGVLLADWFGVEGLATLGYHRNRFEETVGVDETGGSYNALRAGTSVKANAFTLVEMGGARFNLEANAGFRYSHEWTGSYRTRILAMPTRVSPPNARVGTLFAGGEAAWLGQMVEPYAALLFEHDAVNNAPDAARTGTIGTVGLRLIGGQGFSGGVAASAELVRRNTREFTIGGFLRYAF